MGEVLTREESIELASFMAEKYRQLEIKEAEFIDTKERMDNIPDDTKIPKHSAFKFFWPYLIIASIAEAVVYTICFVFVFAVKSDLVSTMISFILIILTWPAIVIFGAVRAKVKRREYNNGVDIKIHSNQRLRAECAQKLKELEKELVGIENETSAYDDIVPSTMRTYDCMQTVKRTLENNMAENFEEAVSRLKPVGHSSFY
ncbi:MAG: hypothetical protein K6G47_07970 [Clostridia bacterium]|nr:hypothetical protein [Clostridia bacterium]